MARSSRWTSWPIQIDSVVWIYPRSRIEEVTLNWNTWIRQTHRWLSIAFTVSVIVTFVAVRQDPPVVWVSYVPLLPLALLLFTGLYMFVLPYVTKWRIERHDSVRATVVE